MDASGAPAGSLVVSQKTEVTCDGCGTTRQHGDGGTAWITYYGAKGGDLCPTCVRVGFGAIQEPMLIGLTPHE